MFNKSLLIVDDDENNRNILCRRLEKEGYTVIAASDGEEALNILDRCLDLYQTECLEGERFGEILGRIGPEGRISLTGAR